MSENNFSGLQFLRDEESTSIEEVEYSLRRAAEKVSEQNKEDYEDFLYERFGVTEGKEELGPNPDRANLDAEFETSDAYGHKLEFHKRLYEIAEERGVDVPESPLDFSSEYNPEHPMRTKKQVENEFIRAMPTGFSLRMDMSRFEKEE